MLARYGSCMPDSDRMKTWNSCIGLLLTELMAPVMTIGYFVLEIQARSQIARSM